MSHTIYTYQQLQHKSIAQLKQIYSEIGCTVEISDKRCKDAWISAIADYQASKVHKVTDEQATATESLTTEKITFYDYEIYADDKLIASITYDDDLTQPWVVMVNNKEVHRDATFMLCHRYICIHYKDGTLPVQEQLPEEVCTTGNEITVQIFTECEKYGFEILDDGIYNNDVKLGEVGFSDGTWWVVGAAEQKRVACKSALVAVWWLAVAQTSSHTKTVDCEELLDRPFDELTPDEWQWLREYAPVAESRELVAA